MHAVETQRWLQDGSYAELLRRKRADDSSSDSEDDRQPRQVSWAPSGERRADAGWGHITPHQQSGLRRVSLPIWRQPRCLPGCRGASSTNSKPKRSLGGKHGALRAAGQVLLCKRHSLWEALKLHFDAICASAARGVARKKSAASATCAARAAGEASLKATLLLAILARR